MYPCPQYTRAGSPAQHQTKTNTITTMLPILLHTQPRNPTASLYAPHHLTHDQPCPQAQRNTPRSMSRSHKNISLDSSQPLLFNSTQHRFTPRRHGSKTQSFPHNLHFFLSNTTKPLRRAFQLFDSCLVDFCICGDAGQGDGGAVKACYVDFAADAAYEFGAKARGRGAEDGVAARGFVGGGPVWGFDYDAVACVGGDRDAEVGSWEQSLVD